MAGLGYVIYLVSAASNSARRIGSTLVIVPYTSGELFTVVPNGLLCSPIDPSPLSSTGAFCETTCSCSPWFTSAGQRHQDGAACKNTRLQPHRTYLRWIGPCNHKYGQPTAKLWADPPCPAGWMGRNPCRTPAMPCSKHATTLRGGYRS